MKTSNFFVGLLLIFTTISFSNCTPDQFESTDTKDIIAKGKWTVDYFYSGQDKTSQFTGYEFSFTGNGNLSGTTGAAEFTGNWSSMTDVSRNEVIEISIHNQQPYLEDLNQQWKVSDKTPGVIFLNDGGSAQLRLRRL